MSGGWAKTLESRCRPSCARNPDGRGHAKGRAWLHGAVKKGTSILDADAHLRNGTWTAKGHDQGGCGRKVEILLRSGQFLYLRLGATPSGVARKCCASLTRNAQSDGCRGGLAASAGGGPDQGARGADPRDTLHGTPSRPNHPPQAPTLDVGTLQPPGTNGRDNTPLDARRCCSRGIICERACARTC